MEKEEEKLIKDNWELTNRYIVMETLPKEFWIGVSNMANNLNIEIAKVTLIRTKEYAEYVKDKAQLMKLTQELEEMLSYFKKKKLKEAKE